MTEGIIQKVFKDDLDKPVTWYHRSTLIALQQELIAEIKDLEKTVPNKWQLMIKLIGDNQE